MTANEKNILLIVVVVLIIWALSKLANKKKDPKMPYKIKVPFLQDYDLGILNIIIELGMYPVPKVRVADFVKSTIRKVRYISPIASRSVDFLILNPDDFSIAGCVIYTTNPNKDFIQKVCQKVEIPYVTIVPHMTRQKALERLSKIITKKEVKQNES